LQSALHSRFRILNFWYHFKHSLLSQCFPPLHTLSTSGTVALPPDSRVVSSTSLSSSASSASLSTSSNFAPPLSECSFDDVFCCVCCHKPVMERKHILAMHFNVVEADDTMEAVSDAFNSNCEFYHVEPLAWMTEEIKYQPTTCDQGHRRCSSDLDAVFGQFAFQRAMLTSGEAYSIADHCRGPLLCPACRCPVGWFNWEGSRCSCHYLEKPAFQIAKSRVTLSSCDQLSQPNLTPPSRTPDYSEPLKTRLKGDDVTNVPGTPIALHFGIRQSVLKFKSRTPRLT